MPLVLVRIDDRLIHGQVVLGWGLALKPDRIILCSDCISADDEQREMFSEFDALMDSNCEICIWGEDETLRYLASDRLDGERAILVLETPAELYSLVEKGAMIETVNVGGLHFRRGRFELANYIYVDEDDIRYLRLLLERGIELEGRDVPTARRIDIAETLDLL
jgi:PTS system mannose-specific IIB component